MIKDELHIKNNMELTQAISHYLELQMAEQGYILVNTQHQKDKYHGVKIVLTIDRTDGTGVSHDDCAAVTRIAKAQFEELLEDYILEVSSPGVKKSKPKVTEQ